MLFLDHVGDLIKAASLLLLSLVHNLAMLDISSSKVVYSQGVGFGMAPNALELHHHRKCCWCCLLYWHCIITKNVSASSFGAAVHFLHSLVCLLTSQHHIMLALHCYQK